MSWRAVDVEHLIGEDHPARAIWALVGRLNLRAFYQAIESSTEEGGRSAFDPQLLISLWVYAYDKRIEDCIENERDHYRGTDPWRRQADHLIEKQQHQRAERHAFHAERDRPKTIEELGRQTDTRRRGR